MFEKRNIQTVLNVRVLWYPIHRSCIDVVQMGNENDTGMAWMLKVHASWVVALVSRRLGLFSYCSLYAT